MVFVSSFSSKSSHVRCASSADFVHNYHLPNQSTSFVQGYRYRIRDLGNFAAPETRFPTELDKGSDWSLCLLPVKDFAHMIIFQEPNVALTRILTSRGGVLTP